MGTLLTDPEHTTPSLRVKGRLMPYEEFTARLKNYCVSLGFSGLTIRQMSSLGASQVAATDILPSHPQDDAVIILSCRVSYNPRWGGFGGLPQLLVREKYDERDVQCTASFIAPFLQQYLFAKEHIYLTKTEQGRYLITIPESLLPKNGEKSGSRLMIDLDKVAEPEQDGSIIPDMVCGSMITFVLSNAFRQVLDDLKFAWKPGRSIPIDTYLSSDLITFADISQAVDPDSPFGATLLPHLRQIVTHRTPNLWAAEVHLRHEFTRAVATFIKDHGRILGNVLCLAGLDIDMTAFEGHEEHYFVPWKAYLEMTGKECGEEHALEQDDLFVRLMQQDKHCPV